ncbi:AraC family transcriptional regulator [Nonomuraea sp. NPDC059007]|uniref:AraC family transcriptional regulator n=1 Tax=Nonomuraea sp. NPDC059007 TaxID=3346692 RepID=UPI00368B4F3E
MKARAQDWSSYWRAPDRPLEAMHAHFVEHVYHRHSHDSYSFGVTEDGAQSFSCRGAAHTSAAGMIMAFNPDEPHDGHSTTELGFTYRMVHIGPSLVEGALADLAGDRAGLPLFAAPVVADPVLAGALRRLHTALLDDGASALRRDELLAVTLASLVRRAATTAPRLITAGADDRVATLVRDRLHEAFLDDLTADDLAGAAGRSRFAVYRSFHAKYGMPPSDYQRQLRLREARRLIAGGLPISDAAIAAGFSDQSHLTRWFTRVYGLTPGAYQLSSTLA